MIAMAVEVAAQSVNRAYVPLSMAALSSRQPRDLEHMRALGCLVMAGFCLVGAAIGGFAHELLWLLASPAFAPAAAVVPILVFGGVASALYYLFVNVLFFDHKANRLLPLATLTGAALNVGLALTLVPRFGLQGAAVATLAAQVLATILVAALGHRFDPVRWNHLQYAGAFIAALCCASWLNTLETGVPILTGLLKAAVLVALAVVLGVIFWRRPFILGNAALRLLRCRPGEAARLFVESEASS
jgi:O-antigen/teichoic acid export membrane protein